MATAGLGTLETATADEYWEYLERRRGEGDIVWDDELGAWLLFSYDLIRESSLDDDAVWRSIWIRDETDERLGMSDEEWIAYIGPSPRLLPLFEGNAYNQAHRWYFKALSPKVLAKWGETIVEPIVHALIDRFVDRGRAELCSELTDRVGARCSTAIVGLPATDDFAEKVIELHSWRTLLTQHHLSKDLDRELVEKAIDARRELADMVMPFVRERRSGEGDDLISMIWRDGAELFGEPFGELEVASTASQLVASGSGTIGATSGSGLYLLMSTPGLEDDVRNGGPEAIRVFAEEALRLYGPVQLRFRWAKRDVELGGATIKQGQMVVGMYAAGNRDPRRYDDPWRAELQRTAPRAHFGFGAGPRTCPGQSLARFQLERIYAVTLDRLRDLRLDPDAEPPSYNGKIIRRWKPLHATFSRNDRGG
jgi:cytochrome P450